MNEINKKENISNKNIMDKIFAIKNVSKILKNEDYIFSESFNWFEIKE